VEGVVLPATEVVLYAEADGSCPVISWLDSLPLKARQKCIVRLERLAELGHEIRRPEGDLLRDGIYELRASTASVHYRILYFFHEQKAVVSHGLTKTQVVPPREISIAITNRDHYIKNPDIHTFGE